MGLAVAALPGRGQFPQQQWGGAQFAGRLNMISALEGLRSTTELVDNAQPSLATLKISGRGGLMALLSSHPPLETRIERLRQVAA